MVGHRGVTRTSSPVCRQNALPSPPAQGPPTNDGLLKALDARQREAGGAGKGGDVGRVAPQLAQPGLAELGVVLGRHVEVQQHCKQQCGTSSTVSTVGAAAANDGGSKKAAE